MRLAVHIQVLLVAVLAPGCTHTQPSPAPAGLWRPSVVEPADEVEREILRQLPDMPPGQAVTIGGHAVVAGVPYAAASGRTCRSLRVTGSAGGAGAGASSNVRDRLACREDGDWFLVPEVFQPQAVQTSDADVSRE